MSDTVEVERVTLRRLAQAASAKPGKSKGERQALDDVHDVL